MSAFADERQASQPQFLNTRQASVPAHRRNSLQELYSGRVERSIPLKELYDLAV